MVELELKLRCIYLFCCSAPDTLCTAEAVLLPAAGSLVLSQVGFQEVQLLL
jgi:hypothetical protein